MKHRQRFLLGIFAAGLCIGAMMGYVCSSPWAATPAPAKELAASEPIQDVAAASSADGQRSAPATPQVFSLRGEADFLNTLRSCIGHKCLAGVPEGASKDRLALLTPPGRLSSSVGDALRQILMANGVDAEIISTTHAPPYGYGKSHGYTRILRLAPSSLVESVVDLNPSGEKLQQVLVQLVRWHCRISHVAAHTSLLTVRLSDLLSAPSAELEKVLRFAGSGKLSHRALDKAAETLAEARREATAVEDRALGVSEAQRGALDQALDEELASSHNLRDWPCKTIWVAGAPADVSKALSPDCSMPHTTCSVPRDRCEQDGSCGKGSKA
mmetsp:Transcript_16449/g.62509  ORF Transcript_16449/g.62509 Transcript_16449/m.62509 type:complete len:327 (-) Transcript_16449:1329-2309(-)